MMRRAPLSRRIASLGVFAGTLFALPASAGDGVAVAESLFQQGRELMQSGRVEQACEKFAESQRLDPGLGTLLNLASCNEALGKLATAWGQYRQALAEAAQSHALERRRFAKQRVDALEPRLPRLVVEVPKTARAQQLQITLDGVVLGDAAWGVPTPVDPGARIIQVSAPGRRTWTRRLELREGQRAHAKVPALELAPPPPRNTDSGAAGAGAESLLAWSALGLGGASLGIGAFFGIRGLQRNGQSQDLCPTATTCSPRGAELSSQATADARIANWTLGAGALFVATGVVLLLTGQGDDEVEPPASGWMLAPSVAGAAMSYRGVW